MKNEHTNLDLKITINLSEKEIHFFLNDVQINFTHFALVKNADVFSVEFSDIVKGKIIKNLYQKLDNTKQKTEVN